VRRLFFIIFTVAMTLSAAGGALAIEPPDYPYMRDITFRQPSDAEKREVRDRVRAADVLLNDIVTIDSWTPLSENEGNSLAAILQIYHSNEDPNPQLLRITAYPLAANEGVIAFQMYEDELIFNYNTNAGANGFRNYQDAYSDSVKLAPSRGLRGAIPVGDPLPIKDNGSFDGNRGTDQSITFLILSGVETKSTGNSGGGYSSGGGGGCSALTFGSLAVFLAPIVAASRRKSR
jgi:uncharacterized membrane protein YgcG